MRGKSLLTIILIIILIILISSSLFIIDETQQAIVTQFGRPIGEAITSAGIHFKIPFIQTVTTFEKRLLEWDGAPQEIPTKDNKFIHIDTFARWRISDALAFYKGVRNETTAHSRLDDLLDGAVRDEIANYRLPEIVRVTDREMMLPEVEAAGVQVETDTANLRDLDVPGARQKIAASIVDGVQKKLAELDIGIEVIDLQFKRIDYNPQVQQNVFDRMISEQKRIAERYRAIGQGEKQRILGRQEQKKKEILSQAYLEAQTIRGKADAEATNIYAAAYNKSQESRDFYEFLRTLEAYRATFDTTMTLLLTTDNDFMKFLENPR